MRELLHMLRALPRTVQIMLLVAMAKSVSSFALLAYLPVYLHGSLHLGDQWIGYTLGLCLALGTLASLYGGYLADRFEKINLMIGLDLALTALYLALPLIGSAPAAAVCLLVVNTASSTLGVANNALLSELVRSEHRTKVFSFRYSLQNIGAAIGPFLGAWIVGSHPTGPFLLAAGVIMLSLLPVVAYRRQFLRGEGGTAAERPEFAAVLRTMRADRRLGFFTLGGILSIMVYGPLLTYMSQYLMLVDSQDDAYRTVAYISAANAVVVIALQYLLGSRLREKTLLRWLTWGTAAFVVGLVGLASSAQLWLMVAAVAVFTVGEVIMVPAEYMCIDMIAPDDLRGSYFGAQNLIHLGMAFGPIICGFLLEHAASVVMFYALIAVLAVSWLCYLVGCRAARTTVPTTATLEV